MSAFRAARLGKYIHAGPILPTLHRSRIFLPTLNRREYSTDVKLFTLHGEFGLELRNSAKYLTLEISDLTQTEPIGMVR